MARACATLASKAGGAIFRIRGGPKAAEGWVYREGASRKRWGTFIIWGSMQHGTAAQRGGPHIHIALRQFRSQRAPRSPADLSRRRLPGKMQAAFKLHGGGRETKLIPCCAG